MSYRGALCRGHCDPQWPCRRDLAHRRPGPEADSLTFEKLKIVSGGQTGVDRAALDFAIRHKFRHGGWCPKGRRAEDGIIPRKYRLKETPGANYLQRTRWNVRDSDGSLIFSRTRRVAGGTKRTVIIARKCHKPFLQIVSGDKRKAVSLLKQFLSREKICVLNVAGPRESEEPGLGAFVTDVLERALL